MATGWFWVLVSPIALAESAGTEADSLDPRAWREAIARLETPHPGCFEAVYPRLQWRPVECVDPPKRPYGRRAGTSNQAIGGQGIGDEYAARPLTGRIHAATGSFPRVHARSTQGFSLQLNTNPLSSGECLDSDFCDAWQQFVVSSGTGTAFMQYWALAGGTSCPAGWTLELGNCYRSSAAIRVPKVNLAELAATALAGRATPGGDQLTFVARNHAYSIAAPDDVVGLSTFWSDATFNILGDCCTGELQFDAGSSIEVRIDVDGQTAEKPQCVEAIDRSLEMSNLNLGECVAAGGRSPHVSFSESN